MKDLSELTFPEIMADFQKELENLIISESQIVRVTEGPDLIYSEKILELLDLVKYFQHVESSAEQIVETEPTDVLVTKFWIIKILSSTLQGINMRTRRKMGIKDMDEDLIHDIAYSRAKLTLDDVFPKKD